MSSSMPWSGEENTFLGEGFADKDELGTHSSWPAVQEDLYGMSDFNKSLS